MQFYIIVITCTYILLSFTEAGAQDTTLSALQRRIDSLEAKVQRIERRSVRESPAVRTQTRSNLEADRYGGFVVADIFNTKLTVGGFVQGDFMYDFREMGSKYSFIPSTIPVNNRSKGNLAFSPLQTRITIKSQSATGIGELNTLFEFDLFNSNGSPSPHLRHAWGQLGRWGAGQYWSAFMDIDVFPNTLDYQGPNAMVFVRQVQLRYTQPLSKKSSLAFTIEKPGSDVAFASDSGFVTRSLFPDVVAQYRSNFTAASHIQLAVLLHPVSYDDHLGKHQRNIGWGANLTGTFEVNSRIKDNFVYQLTYGQGIARYFNDISGLGYDAVMKNRGDVETLPVYAAMGFYDHWWSDQWSTSLGWAYLRADNKAYQPGNAFKYSNYGVINLLFYPSPFVKVGLEYLYGSIGTKDNSTGNTHRLQFSMMYKF